MWSTLWSVVFLLLSVRTSEAVVVISAHRILQFRRSGADFGSQHVSLTLEAIVPSADLVNRNGTVNLPSNRLAVLDIHHPQSAILPALLRSRSIHGLMFVYNSSIPLSAPEIRALEALLLSEKVEKPVFVAERTAAMADTFESIKRGDEYLFEISASEPQPVKSLRIVNYHVSARSSGDLSGRRWLRSERAAASKQVTLTGSEASPDRTLNPTVAVVAHYDRLGLAPVRFLSLRRVFLCRRVAVRHANYSHTVGVPHSELSH